MYKWFDADNIIDCSGGKGMIDADSIADCTMVMLATMIMGLMIIIIL